MRQKGFTLIETLVVVVMFAAGITVISQMFLSQNRLYLTNTAELNITNGVRTSLDDIDNNVRQAYAVLGTYSTYTASATTLILQVQSVDSNDQLIGSTYDYIIYSLSGSSLSRIIVADGTSSRTSSTRVLASDITALTFTPNNATYALVTEVATSITASENVNFQTRTYTGDTRSRLRN